MVDSGLSASDWHCDTHHSVVSKTIFDTELANFMEETALFVADAFLMSTLLFFFLLHFHDSMF